MPGAGGVGDLREHAETGLGAMNYDYLGEKRQGPPWARLGNGQLPSASESAGVPSDDAMWPGPKVRVGWGSRAQAKVGSGS